MKCPRCGGPSRALYSKYRSDGVRVVRRECRGTCRRPNDRFSTWQEPGGKERLEPPLARGK